MGVKGGARVLIVDGEEWEIDPDSVKFRVETFEREAISAGRGMVGTSEKGVPAFVEAKVFRGEDQDWSSLEGEKASVILRTPTRDITLSAGAWRVGEKGEDAKDASSTVRFEAPSGRAVRAAS